MNTALSCLEGVDVLLLAAVDINEAVRLAILGEPLSKEVVCFSKESVDAVSVILAKVEN